MNTSRRKSVSYIVCLSVLTFFQMAMGQNVSTAKGLVAKVESGIDVKYRRPESIIESRSNLNKTQGFLELEEEIRKSWREILPKIDEVAPTDAGKTIFYKAAQGLPKGEYIELLTNSVTLVEQKVISYRQLQWALFPFDKKLRNMWNEDPDYPGLKQLARRVKEISSHNKGLNVFLDKAIAGGIERPIFGEGDPVPRASSTPDNSTPIPDRITPDLAQQPASKRNPTITPKPKPQTPPASSVPLVVGILLLLAVAGFVFYRRKP